MLLSFSIRFNLRYICDKTVGSDTIPVLHGLKAISMAWVILGHTCIVAFKYSGKAYQSKFYIHTIYIIQDIDLEVHNVKDEIITLANTCELNSNI